MVGFMDWKWHYWGMCITTGNGSLGHVYHYRKWHHRGMCITTENGVTGACVSLQEMESLGHVYLYMKRNHWGMCITKGNIGRKNRMVLSIVRSQWQADQWDTAAGKDIHCPKYKQQYFQCP
jgi:hypothetical protein